MGNIIDELENGKVLLLDGATGTELNKDGLDFGEEILLAQINNPKIVAKLAELYYKAGSDIVITNTFQASSISLERYSLKNRTYEINVQGAKLLKNVPQSKYVAGSVGPTTGEFNEYSMDPEHAFGSDDFYRTYLDQIQALKEGGVDLIVLETFLMLPELESALRASKELGMITSAALALDYQAKNNTYKTIYGVDYEKLTSLKDADIIGFNCGSVTLDQAVELTRRLRDKTDKPILVQPNGGIPPDNVVSPKEFSEYGQKIIEAGANLIGGCCGTDPGHIKELRKVVDNYNSK